MVHWTVHKKHNLKVEASERGQATWPFWAGVLPAYEMELMGGARGGLELVTSSKHSAPLRLAEGNITESICKYRLWQTCSITVDVETLNFTDNKGKNPFYFHCVKRPYVWMFETVFQHEFDLIACVPQAKLLRQSVGADGFCHHEDYSWCTLTDLITHCQRLH